MLLTIVLAPGDSGALGERLGVALRRADTRLSVADAARPLDEQLRDRDVDLVVLHESAATDAEAVVRRLLDRADAPGVIVFQTRADEEERVRLLAAGCLEVLRDSLEAASLAKALDSVITRQRNATLARLRAERVEERYSLDDFVSESDAMQDFLRTARKVVRSDSQLLLLGETGVGKGRLARALHAEGPRADGPFIPVHCAALPESLLESELFGHEVGAFTGATRSRKGYFELAHDGTLFLDEIGEIPPHIQVKLLTAIEEQRVQRIGAEKPLQIDVRIIAATNRDLERALRDGSFREDLYYRLSVVSLTIPPLRERRKDIERLALSYLEHFRQQTGRLDITVQPEALDVLRRYDWPGNVRELINAIERAVLLCAKNHITVEDLPRRIVTAALGGAVAAGDPGIGDGGEIPESFFGKPLPQARAEVVASFEREYVQRRLKETGGRIGDTARMSGINQRHLYDLMRRLGLRKEDFKRG